MESRKSKTKLNFLILIIISICTIITSILIGRFSISLNQLILTFQSYFTVTVNSDLETVRTVIMNVRLPRIAAALLVGGALSVSGASYQGMFKNPMVSPDILGASAGAGFGAALAILFSFSITGIQISAFIFGLGAVISAYLISTLIKSSENSSLVLVLTGMVVSTLFSSFTSMIKYVADPYSKLPAITYWLMGSLSSISFKDVKIIIIPIIVGLVPLLLIRWKLNVLSFGEEEAIALGIDTKKLRILVIICSTLMTASAVSISGVIGWIGLIIPHLARMLVGPNFSILLPTSLILGSTFLLFVDDIARSAFALEIPLGILTSLTGAPFFIYLLIRGRRGWS